MCAIAGIYSYHYAASAACREELSRIANAMAHRGPDGGGEWWGPSGRIGLAHRRLSIIDPDPRSDQPMVSAEGAHVVSFNGEIYNYRHLQRTRNLTGLRTCSDTEVLLELFAAEGENMLGSLRGMYAFAIWDARRGALFLARDPLGIKPLYYADDGWSLRIASEVKGLLAGKVSRLEEPAGWAGFFLLGSVPEPFTTYQEIRALPAGGCLWVDEYGPARPRLWLDVATLYHRDARLRGELTDPELLDAMSPSCSPDAGGDDGLGVGQAGGVRHTGSEDTVRAALLESVAHHLVADVEVGLFLSAGIDSAAVLALARELRPKLPIRTLTLSFEEFKDTANDESSLARTVANRYGAHHHLHTVSRGRFEESLGAIMAAMDQPSIDGANTWFIAKAARELGLKVALSGIGGDELFGGYPSFHDVPRWHGYAQWPSRLPIVRRLLTYAAVPLVRRLALPPKLPGLLRYASTLAGTYFVRRALFMPWELPALMGADRARAGLERLGWLDRLERLQWAAQHNAPSPCGSYAPVAALETGTYLRNQLLRDADWAGMAHGVEIRTPLVDCRLLAQVGPQLARAGRGNHKHRLASSPQLPVPEAVVARPKTGFVLPMQEWLSQGSTRSDPLLDPARSHWSRRFAYAVYQQATGDAGEGASGQAVVRPA